jgi:hypothetical protein
MAKTCKACGAEPAGSPSHCPLCGGEMKGVLAPKKRQPWVSDVDDYQARVRKLRAQLAKIRDDDAEAV